MSAGTTQKIEEGGARLRAVEVLKAAGVELKGVVAAKVDGAVVDLGREVDEGARVEPVAAASPEGLDVIRHSAAHLMAQAVQRIFPGTQVTIGPVIENGFFYDFARPEGAFTPEDLEKIQKEMKKIVKDNLKVSREVLSFDEAVDLFSSMGEEYKVEIIRALPADQPISVYRQGEFVDLCRGPHVPSTGHLKAVQLTHVAGAYWRGDEHNAMLQRIYGTAFADREALEAHLARLEEAKKRDHRRLGQELDLFTFDPVAPGSPFFHPKGAFVYNRLISYVRSLYDKYGYDEVITPQVMDVDLWHKSGHYENYKENMYFSHLEEREFAVKPMNCPSHCVIFASRTRSYRDLPIRYADFGRLHRAERSGTLHGLTRVRSFSQDDAHIFCTPEQIGSEIASFLKMVDEVYADFGFDERRVYLSTRPEKSIGSDELWEKAEAALADALNGAEMKFEVNAGDGAFYGPKIDFVFFDALQRGWQLATIQLDFGALPERFDLKYVRPDGTEGRPVMIHRAVLGAIERFMGILIEHCGGAFPLWLAPEQVRVLTLTERNEQYGAMVCDRLRAAGLRAELDDRNEKLGFKIREAQVQKVPYAVIVGDDEMEKEMVAPRRHGESGGEAMRLQDFVDKVVAEAKPRAA